MNKTAVCRFQMPKSCQDCPLFVHRHIYHHVLKKFQFIRRIFRLSEYYTVGMGHEDCCSIVPLKIGLLYRCRTDEDDFTVDFDYGEIRADFCPLMEE